HDAGYPDEALRYGDLAARYEQSAEAAPAPAAAAPKTPAPRTAAPPSAASSPISSPASAASAAVPPAARAAAALPAPWPMAAPAASDRDSAADAHPEFAVQDLSVHAPSDAHELSSEPSAELSSDLSSEWEESLSVDEPAAAAEQPATFEAAADASSNPEIAETVEEVRFY